MKEQNILTLIEEYGSIDGGHHKQWMIDQILRELLGDSYEKWVTEYNYGEDGADTFFRDTGIAH